MSTEKKGNEFCCDPGQEMGSCKIESLVSIDERGQMVIPKEFREKARIKAGDKFALVNWEKDGKVCCLFLVKAEDLTGMIKGMLSPVMKQMAQ